MLSYAAGGNNNLGSGNESGSGGNLSRVAAAAAANQHYANIWRNLRPASMNTGDRSSSRYSFNALYSMVAEQDVEVEDELSKAQKRLRDLKTKISSQSKKNFILERDVRYLDSRIALLIQNRMALEDENAMTEHMDDTESVDEEFHPGSRKLQQYSNLFFLLQTEPRHIAALCQLVSLSEIDTLLQTVMFSLFGSQYDSREEHLLLTMFQAVLAAQFETATNFGSLLRANTPISRMMTTYTRRGPGQSYLKAVLSGPIEKLVAQKDLNLEINPLKVYEEVLKQVEEEVGTLPPDMPRGVPAEVAAENQQVQKLIAPRVKLLMELANQFLDDILNSTDQVPYGIRWICKQIRSLTKRKYPQANDYAICSLIGGFFFLRFVNPAVVTPQAYMLIDGMPSKHPMRTLTLIAKMLQNLANKPTYSKEAYMFSLNGFVEDNKTRINRFLNELCEVSDFYESLEMDQYIALSRKDLTINITLNEMANTHQLLTQHKDALAPTEKHHLRILLNEMGPPLPQMSKARNKAIELPLFSRWETPIQDLTTALMSENNITQNDILYMETKALFVQLVRSMPQLQNRSTSLDLQVVAEMAATCKDPMLVRKGIKGKEMLRELEELGIVDAHDGYRLLVEEIQQELTHLGSLREKVDEEFRSLESVYTTICEHNTYLRSQLESYKAYLQNARLQASGDKNSAGLGVVTVGKKQKPVRQKTQLVGPFKFAHQQLEKDGIIVESGIPENRQSNVYFSFISPQPGAFVISLHYKNRERPILELDLKLDDLLEKQQDNVQILDLEYVQLNVNKLLHLLNKTFSVKHR
ncbi:uncharacterized protein VTP21DRAFT_10383 [Calcarisporiella thermophila]|uniref:uncharacterized protein n=1 Tax=Calcarisporiella thermophila TaxID=911321 RepID=UPI003743EA16